METIYKKAKAKINLTLNVLEKREDGYHNLETIFQKINLYDEIYVSKINNEKEIKITANIPNLEGEENTIFKAYQALKEKYKDIGGVNVKLKKNIPIQAGLAGGSTDCASFIECMNKLFNLNMSINEMIDMGAKIGADVPQALYTAPIIARGIGEKIQKIKSNAKYYIVIIKPEFSCNTKEMFEKLDSGGNISQKYNSENMIKALENGNIKEISENLYNVFEIEVEKIEKIKKEMKNAGAVGSLMTGSGSAVYGIFENKEKAKKGFRELRKKYNAYYCIPYNH